MVSGIETTYPPTTTSTSEQADVCHDHPADALKAAVCSDTLHLRLPTRPEMVEPTVMLLKERAVQTGACSHDHVTNLVIALTEAITNAIIHGNLEVSSDLKEKPDDSFSQLVAQRSNDPAYAARIVDILVEDNGNACSWTITDQGRGFNVDSHLQRLDGVEPDIELASGRGILLMRALMKNVSWANHGRQVSMTLFRQSEHSLQPPRQTSGASPFDLPSAPVELTASRLAKVRRLLLELEPGNPRQVAVGEIESITRLAGQKIVVQCTLAAGTETAPVSPEAQQAIDKIVLQARDAAVPNFIGRRDVRVMYTEAIQIKTESGAVLTAIARNISRSGIAFVADFKLPKGQIVEITLESNSGEPFSTRAKIVRTHRIAAHFNDYGAEFIK